RARRGHDLIGGVLDPRPADLRDRLHPLDGLEELHPDRDRAKAQILVQPAHDGVPVVSLVGHPHSPCPPGPPYGGASPNSPRYTSRPPRPPGHPPALPPPPH